MIELNQLEKYIISKKDKIQISSKDIKSGDVFLALKGKRFHGTKECCHHRPKTGDASALSYARISGPPRPEL